LLTFLIGDAFDQKRRTFLKELEETQDLQNSLLERQHAVVAGQKAAHDRARYLRKQLGLLTKQEEEMFAREGASIAQVEYLEQDIARSQAESSESALSPFAFDFEEVEIPDG
jgi:hypothetical protein